MNRDTFAERCTMREDLMQQKRLINDIMLDTQRGITSNNMNHIKYPILLRIIRDSPTDIGIPLFDQLAELGYNVEQSLKGVEKLLNIDPE